MQYNKVLPQRYLQSARYLPGETGAVTGEPATELTQSGICHKEGKSYFRQRNNRCNDLGARGVLQRASTWWFLSQRCSVEKSRPRGMESLLAILPLAR